MYFGGEGRASEFRLRPSNARQISHGSLRIRTDMATQDKKILIGRIREIREVVFEVRGPKPDVRL
jgi:hypothetical protein